jgi:molybdate transport system substrate-binding protein
MARSPAIALLALIAGLAAPPARAVDGKLAVYAAASLTEVVTALGKGFAGATVVPSFGASSELARQIRDGAPADVFLSASPEWIDFVAGAGKLDGDAVVFARGTLVAVGTRDGGLAAKGVVDAATLLAKGLAADDGVAIADAGVPAGEYARKALASLGLAAAYEARLVGQKDVRAVLNAVAKGELPAGFVYATDARFAEVEVLFAFDAKTHPPIAYLGGAVKGAVHAAEARAFLAYLKSAPARAELAKAGFALP